MRDFFAKRPWMWIVLLLGAMVLSNIVLMVISLKHAPVAVPH